MNIFTKLLHYYNLKHYQKYKKSPCSKCGKFNWKYCYAPFVQNNKKGAIEARVCGNCGYKDGEGYFVSDEVKLNKNFDFKVKK